MEAMLASGATVTTRNGIRAIPDRSTDDLPPDGGVSASPDRKPADALDTALLAISARYSDRTADMVAMRLEYPR